MSNLYAPPKAVLGDPSEAPQLPRGVRLVRGLAVAERVAAWGAVLVNVAATGLCFYAFYAKRWSEAVVLLIFMVPALLNVAAIPLLRSARARLA
jgi:hypothetical protein